VERKQVLVMPLVVMVTVVHKLKVVLVVLHHGEVVLKTG
jgi:hypothetical protein